MNTFKPLILSLIAILTGIPAFCSSPEFPSDDKLPGNNPQTALIQATGTTETELKPLDQGAGDAKLRKKSTQEIIEASRARIAALKAQAEALKEENKAKKAILQKKTASNRWNDFMGIKTKSRVVKLVSEGRKIPQKDTTRILGLTTTDDSFSELETCLYEVIREEIDSTENTDFSDLMAGCQEVFEALTEMPDFNRILADYTRYGNIPSIMRNAIKHLDASQKQKVTEYIKSLLDQRIAELKKAEKKPTLSREQRAIMIKDSVIETRMGRIRKLLSELSVINCDKLKLEIQVIEDKSSRTGLEEMLHEIEENLRQVRLTDEHFQSSFYQKDLDTQFRDVAAYEKGLPERLDPIIKRYQDLIIGLKKSMPKPVVEYASSMQMKSTKRVRAPKAKIKRSESMEKLPSVADSTSSSSEEEEGDLKPLTFKAGNEAEVIFAEAREGKAFELLKILQESRGNLFKLIKKLSAYPGSDLHELNFDRKGQYSIKVSRGDRICFSKGDDTFTDVEIVNYH